MSTQTDQSKDKSALWEEYKLLQDKVDKIAGFRFVVKGWSATLIGALVIGSVSAKLPWGLCLLALAPLVGFYLLEFREDVVYRVIINRLDLVDKKLLRRKVSLANPAVAIASLKSDEDSLHQALKSAFNTKWYKSDKWGRKAAKSLLRHINEFFYGAQCFVIVGVAIYAKTRSDNPQEFKLTNFPETVSVQVPKAKIQLESDIGVKVVDVVKTKSELSGQVEVTPGAELNVDGQLRLSPSSPLAIQHDQPIRLRIEGVPKIEQSGQIIIELKPQEQKDPKDSQR